MTANELTPDLAAFIEAQTSIFSRHRQRKRTAAYPAPRPAQILASTRPSTRRQDSRQRRPRFAETKIEHLVLARPFGGQVGEASDTHTVREPAVDGRVDEIGREECKRDRHVNSLLDRCYGKPVAPVELGNAGEFDHLSDDVNRQCEA